MPRDPRDGPLRGRLIVVVDDRAEMVELLADALRAAGADVVAFVDPHDVLDAMDHVRIDAIVSDLHMPRLDGLELVRRVKARSPRVAAVAITGSEVCEHVDPAHAARAGFDCHLQKPVEPRALIEVLARIAPRRRYGLQP